MFLEEDAIHAGRFDRSGQAGYTAISGAKSTDPPKGTEPVGGCEYTAIGSPMGTISYCWYN